MEEEADVASLGADALAMVTRRCTSLNETMALCGWMRILRLLQVAAQWPN